MLALRPTAILLALFALASCAYIPGGDNFNFNKCKVDYSEHLQGVDWEKAKKINVRIRQGDFTPTYIGLYMAQPYVLSIENADDYSHSFRAMDFFRAIALDGVRIGGGRFEAVDCLDGVGVPAGKTTQLRFVAVRDGTYEYDDNSLMISLAMIGSGGGFITIEPPRVISESPVKHLMLRENTIVESREEPKPSGLFDDQEEAPAPSPGLFDDQETAPVPPSGLFDDQEVAPTEPSTTSLFGDEQPVQPSPSVPVQAIEPPVEAPGEGLFSDPTLTPDTEIKPDEGLFGEPALEPAPDETPSESPEASVTPELPEQSPSADPSQRLFESVPELVEKEEEMIVLDESEVPADKPVVSDEEEMFVVEEPALKASPETMPQPPAQDAGDSGESLTAKTETITPEPVPEPQIPAAFPEGFEALEGPPADIYSDPPDVVNTGPGSGGDGGEDTFSNAG